MLLYAKICKMFNHRGVYIKYVEGGPEGFTNLSEKNL